MPAWQMGCCTSCQHATCRLLACFLLLALGRVVNIALPLAYKKVIDRLAATGAAAASSAAEAAAAAAASGADIGVGSATLRALCRQLALQAVPTFRDVFFPWVAAYLALTFLQAGRAGRAYAPGQLARVLPCVPLQAAHAWTWQRTAARTMRSHPRPVCWPACRAAAARAASACLPTCATCCGSRYSRWEASWHMSPLLSCCCSRSKWYQQRVPAQRGMYAGRELQPLHVR